MDLSQQKVRLLDLRVVDNELVFVQGDWFESFEYLGAGTYQINLSQPVDFDQIWPRVCLFGNPVVGD